MSRTTNAAASRERRRKRLRLARGFHGGRSRLFRTATESVDRARAQATKHRRVKKRDYRRLWTIRIGAACRPLGLTYSRLIEGLTRAGVELNRKMLSEIAIHDPQGFASIVGIAKSKLA